MRTLKCLSASSYVCDRKLRRTGRLHGLSEVSEATRYSLLERYDALMRDDKSNSLRISAISSTGKDSKSMPNQHERKSLVVKLLRRELRLVVHNDILMWSSHRS